MADNLRKFTTQEVLNKVYSDSSGNSIGINAATSKETLNAALDTSNSRLNVSLAGGTIGGDVTINGDLTVNGDAEGAYDEIINGQLEVRGDATDSATGMTGFLTLSTAFTDINATDQLGRINFQAPLEAGGTDAILAGASIYGIAEATFANNNNSTGIAFATATSSVPIERMRIDSSGNIGIGIASPTSKLSVSAGRGANTGLEILDSADSNNKRIDLRLDADGDGYLSLVNASETTKVQLYSNGVSYFNGGNVGIGTNSPDALMHLKSTSSDSKIIIESSHASSSGSVDIRSASDRDSSVLFREGTTVKARIRNDASADALVLTDGVGTDTMHIKGSNVGIGVDAPTSLLHIQSNDSTTDAEVDMLTLQALSTGTTTTGFGGAIKFQAERNNGVSQNVGKIRSIAEVNSGNNISSGLSFETGTFGTLNESMRITYDGKVGIGTATPTMSLEISNTSFGDQLRLHRSSVASGGFLTLSANDSAGNIHDYAKIGTIVESSTNASEDGSLVFQTSLNSTLTEYMRITSTGNVGIGIDTPVDQGLTVANTGDVNLTLLADSDANGANNWPIIDFRVDNTSGNPEARIYYKQDATSLILATSNTTALTLDSSQNATFAQKIGVGASPQSFPDKNVTIEGTSAGLVLRDSTGDNQATQWGTLFTSNNNVRMMYDDSGTFQVGNADDYQGTNYEANLILDANSRISLSNNNVSGATNNTVFGKLAGDDLESGGIQNSLFGENAGHALRTGDENALLGMDSGALLQNGSRNVAIGKSSANSHATFSDCVVIGQSAEVSANSASNQIVIGRSATGVADNSVSLGNASVTNLYIAKGNDTAQTITFQDSSNTGGDIQYDHSDNQMKFGVADAVRVRIFDSALLVGRSSTGSTGNGHSIRTADSAIFSRDASGETMQVCRNADNGQFIQFRANGSIVGDIKNTGGTVSLTGFSGCHESSSSDTLEVGMVVSTIDEEHSENHAKVEISNSVGDKRVYGVVSDLEGLDGSNVTIASVGISSIKVTGSCVGGDLLESNGDGTAKVQSDDIIRSKTIGKVTMGNSTEEVKMVSCVLYCG